MKLKMTLTFATLMVAATSSSWAQKGDRYELSGKDVTIYNLVGSMRVETGTGNTVTVETNRIGRDASRVTIKTMTIDGRATLTVIYPDDEIASARISRGSSTTIDVDDNGIFGRRGGHRVRITSRERAKGDAVEADVDMIVRVPAGHDVDVHQAVGDIDAAGIVSDLSLGTSTGDITASSTRGKLTLNSASGRVHVTSAQGDLDLNTASGDVVIESVSGRDVKIDVASGDIKATGLRAERANLSSASGSIRASDVHAPDFKAESASGSVHVTLDGELHDVDVSSASGTVEVVVPDGFGGTVEMETSSGSIDTDFQMSITSQRRGSLRGRIGDGTAHVSLSTASGDVRLLKR